MIRYAEKSDYNEIFNLWNNCFEEDFNFSKWYFKNKYNYKNTLLYINDNKICSMIQQLPYKMSDIGNVNYIFGACTEKKYRNKGIMAELLNYSFKIDKLQKINASVLIPQENSLFGFYEKFGYKVNFYLENKIIKKNDIIMCNYNKDGIIRNCNNKDINKLNDLYEYNLKNTSHIIRLKKDWEILINMFNNLNGYVYCLEKDNNIISYAFIWKNNPYWIQEIMSLKDCYNNIFYLKLMDKYKLKNIKVTLNKNEIPFGCIKKYYDEDKNKCYYMNLMFN